MIEHSESCRDAQVERVRIEHLSRKLITMSHKLTKTPSLEVLIRKLSSSYASPNDYRSLSEQILQITESTPEMKELTYLIKEHMEHVSNVITLWEKAKSTLTSPTDEKVPPMISLGVPDFTELRPLARGAFGRVHLVQRKKTGDIFAMKIIPKEELNTKDGMHRILSEREAMTRAMSNYVVPLYFTFQSGNSLFLVMEYSPGGDLFALLQELGSLDEDTARFYGLEIVKALKHLHERGIVHCDIKPDNLLISADGHIKLTDFGLSKVDIIDRALSNESDLFSSLTSSQMIDVDDTPTAKTAPGTPEYLAPEILLGQSFGKEADWWSFGAVMYELVEGVPPFCGDNPAEVFEDVVKGEFTWTVDASDELKDLVAGLLNTDPKKRFGINEVLSHPFFNNVAASNDEPPFQPSLENGADPVYFRQARHSLVGTADRLTDESFLILNKQVQQWNVINYYTLFDLNKKISENSKC
ncbi:AGC family protein kinase [Histomonas meleagridis]|uniref:AGC family protein kinase n=1 Tax=Histomonas meleagridis TaxID=135588 RepID=UPI00355A1865|nr:AGC family protein kinase [Histomonas meleagridis]KAH0805536.1 AGC family protein kinase [Histomonas meleagridis]